MMNHVHRFVCVLCANRSFNRLSGYLLHLRIRHANDVNFRVICGISKCRCEYDKYASFYKHIRRHHSDLLFKSMQTSDTSYVDGSNCDSGSDDNTFYETGEFLQNSTELVDVAKLQDDHLRDLSESVFKYSLKLREKYLIPASTHADIMSDCKSLITSVLSCQRELVCCHLKNNGYAVSSDNELLQGILDSSKYEQLWSDCESSYKLSQNCSKKFNMIKPTQYVVGEFKSYYISVTEVLKMLVQKVDVMPYVLESCFSDNDFLTSYRSGKAFKFMVPWLKDGNLLLLHLYNDEFDVVNPIGARRGKHKLNATYFTLGNLPSKYRSCLQHIFLTNMVKHKAVKENGYAVCFAPLVAELQKLYNDGFSITLPDGHIHKFYAILCTVSGDNLSSHALAGFRQVFNSGRVCRVCMIDHTELTGTMCEKNVTLRNAANHTYHVEAVKENPNNVAIYGVSGPSVFSPLEYFDVIQGFPPDIMHDCMEGVVPAIVSAIIKLLVSAKVITVPHFNKTMMSFPLKGSDCKNKPEPIRRDCSIVGSASQKMCLFRLLPFLVDLEKCSIAYRLYILTREVMMYAFCRCLSTEDLDYFEQKIEGLRLLIQQHFAGISITPKFHFLMHYPTMMARYGPLRDLWCMRYEAKHQYFKSVANTLGNFINIAHTLSSRHQMLQCYLFSGTEILGQALTLPKSGKLVSYTSLPVGVQRCLCYAQGSIWSVNEAASDGCSYAVGAATVVDFTGDGDPVCIQITHLLIPHEGHLDIIGKLLLPVAFCKKYYAYEFVDSGWGHFHPGSEKDCSQLQPYDVDSVKYISLPYYIPPWSRV